MIKITLDEWLDLGLIADSWYITQYSEDLVFSIKKYNDGAFSHYICMSPKSALYSTGIAFFRNIQDAMEKAAILVLHGAIFKND